MKKIIIMLLVSMLVLGGVAWAGISSPGGISTEIDPDPTKDLTAWVRVTCELNGAYNFPAVIKVVEIDSSTGQPDWSRSQIKLSQKGSEVFQVKKYAKYRFIGMKYENGNLLAQNTVDRKMVAKNGHNFVELKLYSIFNAYTTTATRNVNLKVHVNTIYPEGPFVQFAPAIGAQVHVFPTSGSGISAIGNTNSYGNTAFLLPQGEYFIHVKLGSLEKWETCNLTESAERNINLY